MFASMIFTLSSLESNEFFPPQRFLIIITFWREKVKGIQSILSTTFIRGIEIIEVFAVELILNYSESLTESLEMDYFAFTQKSDRCDDIWIIDKL